MKKLLLLIALASARAGYGQKFEVSASYGTPSLYGLANDIVSGIFSSNDSDDPGSNGVLGISALMYNNSEKWRYGLDFALETFNTSGLYDASGWSGQTPNAGFPKKGPEDCFRSGCML